MIEHKKLTFDGRVGMYHCSHCSKCWEVDEETPPCTPTISGRDKFLKLKQDLVIDGQQRTVKQTGDN